MKPEILAPCRDFEVLKAAISAGCDAVYFAGVKYGARSYIENFTNEEIIKAIIYAHSFNCLVYVTVNTVILEDEIEECLEYIDFLYLNNVDALIIQDLGLASIVKCRYPDLKIHASTQINAQTIDDVLFLKEVGFSRVVLGREVSLGDLKNIRKVCDIELEIFVHGALCINYSGLCYISSMTGGRSGNRGRCAQPCRLLYKLKNDKKYYLSTKDLCLIDKLKDFEKIVTSFKIEGRVKSKEYVYNTVKHYVNSLESKIYDYKNAEKEIGIFFNRQFTKGFLYNEEKITNTNSSNHQGILVALVLDNYNNKTKIKLLEDIFVFDALRFDNDAIIVNEIYIDNVIYKKGLKNQIVDVKTHKKILKDTFVYLTKREIKIPEKTVLIEGITYLKNNLFHFEITDGLNNVFVTCEYEDSINDQKEVIKNQLSKTNDTIFRFNNLIINDSIFIKKSILNKLRRDALDILFNKRIERKKRKLSNLYPAYNFEKVTFEFKKFTVITDNDIPSSLASILDNNYEIYTYNKESNKMLLPRINEDAFYNKDDISSNLGTKTNIKSCYCHVYNSFTVLLFLSLGIKKIGLSIELSKKDIIALVTSLKSKLNKLPNLEVFVYGCLEVMIMKHKFIDIKEENEFISNEFDKYLITKDKYNNLILVSTKCINLLSEVNFLNSIGITNFLLDLRYNDYKKEEKPFLGFYEKGIL